jgi:hypothetical protein
MARLLKVSRMVGEREMFRRVGHHSSHWLLSTWAEEKINVSVSGTQFQKL